MQRSLVICSVALSLTACQPSLEKQLVGEWLSGCSIDTCTITTLKADRTFSEKFDEKDSSDSYSGTWRVEGDQLIMHVTWADKVLQDIVGKNMRVVISEFHHDSFVGALADDRRKSQPWKRLH